MKKILLLNPPSDAYYLRDYYCSHLAKGRYYWPPLDLLVLSGVLDGHGGIYVLDALINGLSSLKAQERITRIAPDVIISVAGAASWRGDMFFLNQIKTLLGVPIVVSGDYPLAEPERVLAENSFIDAVLMDFTDSGIAEFIRDNGSGAFKNVVTRSAPGRQGAGEKMFAIPVPRHDLFPLKSYHLPHIEHHPFTTIMTDYGCPFHCSFCPFERIPYKRRDMSNVAQELLSVQRLGIKELWLRDQSFGAVRSHAVQFCDVLMSMKRPFTWSCEMRVDAADETLLRTMKNAGCHTVMFGVESASPGVLLSYNKGITLAQVREAFRVARKVGLKTLAHFIIGLKGESRDSQMDMIRLCLALDPDYASFNVATPLWNTTFRDDAIRNHWLTSLDIEVDSSNSFPIFEAGGVTREEMWQLRMLAIRRFYLRPSFLIRQLKEIRSFYRARTLLREGICLVGGLGAASCLKERQ